MLTSRGNQSPSCGLCPSALPSHLSDLPSPHSGCAWLGVVSGVPQAEKAVPCYCKPVGTGDTWNSSNNYISKEQRVSLGSDSQRFKGTPPHTHLCPPPSMLLICRSCSADLTMAGTRMILEDPAICNPSPLISFYESGSYQNSLSLP